MYDRTFPVKSNGSPCGKHCPERTTTCRPTCERFHKYDAERLQRDSKWGMYGKDSTETAGQRRRHIRNLKYQKLHTQGRM